MYQTVGPKLLSLKKLVNIYTYTKQTTIRTIILLSAQAFTFFSVDSITYIQYINIHS